MSTERDVTRIVRSWLEEGVTQLPDRVLDAVLDQLPAIPQRRAGWLARRFPTMNNNLVRFAVAAVVAGLAITVAVNVLPRSNIGGPTATPTSITSPSAAPAPVSFVDVPTGPLSAGAYVVDRLFPAVISFTLPEGWGKLTDGTEVVVACGGESDPGGCLGFWIASNVPADACDPEGPMADPPVGPGIDDLANALAASAALTATDPVDVSVSGFEGRYLELQAFDESEICLPELFLYTTSAGSERGLGAGELARVWILEVDGVRVLMEASINREGITAPGDVAELEAVIQSVEIEAP